MSSLTDHQATEESLLNELGGKFWEEKYPIGWCHLCGTANIYHKDCPGHGSSCNAGGCDECSPVFDRFHKCKTHVREYLTPEEDAIYKKGLRIQHFIQESIAKGQLQIDWKKLKADGNMSRNDEVMFAKELNEPTKSQ